MSPSLIKYARSLARDQDAAQDLVQEAALRAWAARSRFVTGTNFKAWCYRILRNCFLTQVRRRQIARTDSRGDNLPEVPIAPDQEVVLEVQDVARVWRRLSNDQQRSLALVAIDGHSYEVAAAMDNVPLGTMKSRVARGRETLLALLDGEPRSTASEPAEPNDDCIATSEMPVLTAPVTSRVAPDPADRTQVELLRAWRERRRMASMAIAA